MLAIWTEIGTQPLNGLASALHWILEHNYGVDHLLHYLDDFFTAGPASYMLCFHYVKHLICLLNHLKLRSSHFTNLSGHTP